MAKRPLDKSQPVMTLAASEQWHYYESGYERRKVVS